MIIDAKEFANAVVSSSSPELSVKDKAKLYEEAYDFIIKRNSEIKAENRLSAEEQLQRAKQLKSFLG